MMRRTCTFFGADSENQTSAQNSECTAGSNDLKGQKVVAEDKSQLKLEFAEGIQSENSKSTGEKELAISRSSMKFVEEPIRNSCMEFGGSSDKMGTPNVPHDLCSDSADAAGAATITREVRCFSAKLQNSTTPAVRSDKDSSRMHVFCLEHAIEVERQLRPVGGVHIMLLCHPGEFESCLSIMLC